MKKPTKSRLPLHTETIRDLSADQLAHAAGGSISLNPSTSLSSGTSVISSGTSVISPSTSIVSRH